MFIIKQLNSHYAVKCHGMLTRWMQGERRMQLSNAVSICGREEDGLEIWNTGF